MTPQERFAKEHSVELAEVQQFSKLGEKYAKRSTNECNGEPHPNARDRTDKSECAKLWGNQAARVADEMTKLATKWGFNHLDFGVGFYPTLQRTKSQTDGTVMFPYDN